MDLVYMSDALSYHSIRTPIYDRYEYKQNNAAYNKGGAGKPADSSSHRSGSKCPICREKQKRKLSAYIRNKCSNANSEQNRIVEEEEESQSGGTCVEAH